MTIVRTCACLAALAAGALVPPEFPAPQAAEPLRPAVWPFRDHMPVPAPAQAAAATGAAVQAPQPLKPLVWSPGEYLPSNRLSAADEYRERMPEGYRGLSLTMDADQLMFVKPGDLVDILATLDLLRKGKADEKVGATMIQMARVLDVRPSESAAGKRVVLLALNPNEAQYVALAVDTGKVRLLPRKAGDIEHHSMEMASFRKLYR